MILSAPLRSADCLSITLSLKQNNYKSFNFSYLLLWIGLNLYCITNNTVSYVYEKKAEDLQNVSDFRVRFSLKNFYLFIKCALCFVKRLTFDECKEVYVYR